ncbi:MAG TPA: MYXO-CTERM sorting domain-containing protein, partial [Polyangiaceae bacterium]|nr:MYXO-CTERM sorting domain-containing protein [Polyangiaceae bacterium]
AYPNPGDIGGGSSPPDLPEPSCASPTNCGTKRSTHATICDGQSGSGGAGGGGGSGSGAGGGGQGGEGEGAGVGGGAGEGGSAGSGAGDPGGGGEEGGCTCRTAPGSGTNSAGAIALAGLAVLSAALRKKRRGEAYT